LALLLLFSFPRLIAFLLLWAVISFWHPFSCFLLVSLRLPASLLLVAFFAVAVVTLVPDVLTVADLPFIVASDVLLAFLLLL
jgi:hypothetical protein